MLAGFLFILVGGIALRGRGPGMWLVVAGILLFVVGLALSMRRGGSKPGGAYNTRGGYWRDRYVTYDDESQPGFGGGLRGWLRRRRR